MTFQELQYLSEINLETIGDENGEENIEEECDEPESAASTDTALVNRLTPFFLSHVYGINTEVPIINLSRNKNLRAFYSAAHAGIISNVNDSTQKPLQGHKHRITSIATDQNGMYLATADEGEENAIHFWDATDGKLFYSLFTPHPHYGMSKIAISPNGKYLVTVGNEPFPIVKFWRWTYGKEEPDGSWTAPSNFGKPVGVCFNPNIEEYIMVAFEKQVVFFYWITDTLMFSECSILPSRTYSTKVRGLIITGCTYVYNCHECFTSTNSGTINVYGNSLYTMPLEEIELSNIKIYTKTIRISKCAITTIDTIDEMVVTGDTCGYIKFYDKRLRLLQWAQNFLLEPIKSFSFSLDPRKYKLKQPLEFDEDDNFEKSPDYEDRSDDYETLYAQLVPSDATLQKLPFVVRDFFVVTTSADVSAVDFVNNSVKSILTKMISFVAAIDIHSERPYMVIGFDIGIVYLVNYEENRCIIETSLPDRDQTVINEQGDEIKNEICVLKYNPESLALICGTACGNIWHLDPVLLEPRHSTPYKAAKGVIQKICFSNCGYYFAYYDSNRTVCLYHCVAEAELTFIGKVRAHYKPINGIIFSAYDPPRLFTIAEDRLLIEYDVLNCGENKVLSVINSERISQCAIPSSISYLPKKPNYSYWDFCLSDDQFKFRTINDQTFMCKSLSLGPTYECFEESVITKTKMLKGSKDYLIFMNNTRIGLQKLPYDGNPYRYIGITGHPIKLKSFVQTANGKYMFTIGENDRTILQWEIHTRGVDYLEKMGGEELQPFYCLIEGGKEGWLYKEIEDLFYYMQILHQGANTLLPRQVSDYISICEIPDLMRACGFYPTEYEIEDMIIDIKYRNYDETGEVRDECSFLDFVKLYINHKPVHGISVDTLRNAFEIFKKEKEDEDDLTRESFIEGMCEIGEPFTKPKLTKCLSVLMHFEGGRNGKEDLSFLPPQIDFDFFLNDMLGVDMNRTYVEETKVSKNAVEEDLL